jgi:hypothetical protein
MVFSLGFRWLSVRQRTPLSRRLRTSPRLGELRMRIVVWAADPVVLVVPFLAAHLAVCCPNDRLKSRFKDEGADC